MQECRSPLRSGEARERKAKSGGGAEKTRGSANEHGEACKPRSIPVLVTQRKCADARSTLPAPGQGLAYGNLGNAYRSLGDYAKAIEYYTQDLAIAKDVGDRVGEGMVYATNLSAGHMYLNEFKHKTVTYFEPSKSACLGRRCRRERQSRGLALPA